MKKFACSLGIAALLALGATSANAASVRNLDNASYTITADENGESKTYNVAPNGSIADFCAEGCYIGLGGVTWELYPSDQILILDGNLYFKTDGSKGGSDDGGDDSSSGGEGKSTE